MNQVKQIIHNNIGILEIDYPPVNALSQAVRHGLVEGINAFESDNQISAIIIRCANRTFIAGADIKEFGQPPTTPFLPDVVNRIEASTKPVVASLFGTSLGGGFEVALACHYRVAMMDAKVGLPEVNLGLIPGAGGTQRLPRIVGEDKSLEMITGGKHYSAASFVDSHLFDALFESDQDLNERTIAFVEKKLEANDLNVRRVGEQEFLDENYDWQTAIEKIKAKARGKEAPLVAATVLQKTVGKSIADGMAIEREAFLKLRESEQSAALRYAFSAEKQAAKTKLQAEPKTVKEVAVIGAGNMGSGIATAFLSAGFTIHLIEQTQEGLDAGVERVASNFSRNVKSGRMGQAAADDCMSRLVASTRLETVENCELIIEAIFEDIEVKKTLFTDLDKLAQPTAVLATNTSYLDINQIAEVVSDPSRVIGMHFFSPANIMKLLEVVKAERSSDVALATAMAVGKQLKKMSVLVGVCFGFAGNRMYTRYGREIQQMLLEGAGIEQIDKAMASWGMAMGPLAVQDLSGIDIGHNARSAQPFPAHDPGYFRAAAVMVENQRLGRKTGKGFYQYPEGKAVYDQEAANLIREKGLDLGITQRSFTNDEIVERALLALISEGIKLYQEGIVNRLSDIDVIWLHGYGFPRHKGGPIFQAKQLGKEKLAKALTKLRGEQGELIWPPVELGVLDTDD
ncbi:3-hydroxyacyl-CoA dehydrogenase [Aliikangiella marina]|uniref:3-hydroxyacyl-CoA dehydrogenase n=1 Tax=Aliikangiella marina TaxID=1712262 RepID=A0A545T2T7_9GAMM|nr:3-hydroxyacyl-CoA dehydrogenase NAD-binding domain-containing protein [Aliikangiella marina]TQV71526.1 3-hydroxyacyl-CoA dehydrogenase [Aliikangiella marina]